MDNPDHLEFILCDNLKASVESAAKSLQELADDLDLNVLIFNEFGKTCLKSLSLSPDSFAQVSASSFLILFVQSYCS